MNSSEEKFHSDSILIEPASKKRSAHGLVTQAGLNIYYGDLHNHTLYSDGAGAAEQALSQMRDRNLSFAAITDHGEYFDRNTEAHNFQNWSRLHEETSRMTGKNFVAIRGFEWSSPRQGHSNVWWSAEYTGHLRTGDESMDSYYEWLTSANPHGENFVLGSLNHPGREPECFDQYRFPAKKAERVIALECFNREDDYGDAYFRALDCGWRVGAIGVSDHHGTDWGDTRLPRAGLLAPVLSAKAIQQALIKRRVYATRSPTMALVLTGEGVLMGSELEVARNSSVSLMVWVDDPSHGNNFSRVDLCTNGGRLLKSFHSRGLNQATFELEIRMTEVPEQWFVARVLNTTRTLGYSSPIWVTWLGW